jgi:glycosyltransferase involved in cell wall biosynthesis
MPEKRNIFIGTSVHRWNDNRIFYKEAISLAKRFNVQLHAPADFDQKSLNGVKIFGLPIWKKESDRRKIRKELWVRLKKNTNTDIFIFHDPELIWIGIKVAVFSDIKVIYDIHEDTIQSIRRKKWLTPLNKLIAIIGYSLLQGLSKPIFNHYLLAEDSYKNFIKSKTTVIHNYPIKTQWPKEKEKIFDLVYLGDVTEDRGGLLMIDLLSTLTHIYPEVKLALVGKIEANVNLLINKRVNELKLENHVRIFGYMNYPDAMEIVCKSKIGLCLLKQVKNYIHSYPTKLFDYMQVGVPYVCSNFPLYEELLNECQAGILVEPLNVKGTANEILDLLNNTEKYDRMSQNGINILKNNYNWASQEKKLITVINSIKCS